MTNFLAIVDSNQEQRRAYVKKIENVVPFVPGLRVYSLESGDLSVVWVAGTWTPVDYLVEDDAVAFVLGDAWKGNQRE
jgi:hypothetical protein